MLETSLSSNLQFIAATTAILAVPGPTNALLAASGATLGIRRSLKLIPAVFIAYLGAILAWGCVLAPATAFWPQFAPLLRLACALFLATTAVRLWRGTAALTAKPKAPVTSRIVTLVTLINPKALLFATGLFPPAAFTRPDVFYATALAFAIPLLPIAAAWIGFGAACEGAVGGFSAQGIQKISAIVLGVFSASIGVSALV